MTEEEEKKAIAPDTRLLDQREAAEWLHCSEWTLATWRALKRGPSFIKVGSLARYAQEDLTAFVEERRAIFASVKNSRRRKP
jgi:hypothetical protein